MDTYKYQKLYREGIVSEPVPHLFIISDEFAELKTQQPEFMEQLISTARIGRSLGVHLILATQKPSGTVDDNIWSNSRFRICLKVQEREDSMDMLHNMDACQITQTGRGYLQVGNNEVYELFQAGWSGALFQQEDTEVAACLVQTDGTIYKRRKNAEKNREKKITQLQAIKQYIIRFAIEKEYQEGRKLWLEPLSKYIYLDEIHKEMNKKLKEKRQRVDMNKNLEVCVGIFDDPENQEQSIFSLNLMESGHIAICGRSASGKSTFFQTFLFSLLKESTAEEVCLYLLDFNGSGMDIYDLMPQVKQVIKEEEEDKVEELFENIKRAFNDAWVNDDGSVSYYGEVSSQTAHCGESAALDGSVTRYTYYAENTPHCPSQTAYALAVDFDLIPKDKLKNTRKYFKNSILRNNGKLTVGVLGISHLAPALSKVELDDVAFKLLEQEDNPAWLYSVKNGATTIWER